MKYLLLLILIHTLPSFGQSTRSKCENAYYATGYVKLYEYSVTVSWEKISDHAHVRLETIIFDYFEVLNINHYQNTSIYKIKENKEISGMDYHLFLEELKSLPTKVECTYDI